MIRRLFTLTVLFFSLQGALCAYIRESEIPNRITIVDLTDTKAPWADCWSVAQDLSFMLDNGIKSSCNLALRSLSPKNIKIELIEYKTVPVDCQPKTALFPADAQWCHNLLKIKVRLMITGSCGQIVYEEVITSDHVLDRDGQHHDYCHNTNLSPNYPMTPLAQAHGNFTRDLVVRLERLQLKGIL